MHTCKSGQQQIRPCSETLNHHLPIEFEHFVVKVGRACVAVR